MIQCYRSLLTHICSTSAWWVNITKCNEVVITWKCLSTLQALFEGNASLTGDFSCKRPIMRIFDILFVIGCWTNGRCAGDLRRIDFHVTSNSSASCSYWWHFMIYLENRAPLQYNDHISMYANFHYKDKNFLRPSCLYNGNPYTG